MGAFDRDACVAYVLEKTREAIAFGPRPAGSPAEALTQRMVRAELAASCDGDVSLESFPVAQKAFMGQHRVCAVLMLVGSLGFLVSPWYSLPFTILAMVVIVQELLRYKLFIDPFFPKQTSHNVLGRQRPQGETRKRVVLSGHADAAYEWFFLYRFPKVFPLIVAASLLGLLGKVGIDIVATVVSIGWADSFVGVWAVLCWAHLLLLPGCVIGFLFSDFRHVSPGANDNLTGTFIPLGIAKYMRAAGERLEHTELVVLSAGSEEAGRGRHDSRLGAHDGLQSRSEWHAGARPGGVSSLAGGGYGLRADAAVWIGVLGLDRCDGVYAGRVARGSAGGNGPETGGLLPQPARQVRCLGLAGGGRATETTKRARGWPLTLTSCGSNAPAL